MAIEEALKNRADDSYIGENDCITVGEVRRLVFERDLYKQASQGLGNRLIAGREDKLVKVSGKRPVAVAG